MSEQLNMIITNTGGIIAVMIRAMMAEEAERYPEITIMDITVRVCTGLEELQQKTHTGQYITITVGSDMAMTVKEGDFITDGIERFT